MNEITIFMAGFGTCGVLWIVIFVVALFRDKKIPTITPSTFGNVKKARCIKCARRFETDLDGEVFCPRCKQKIFRGE